MSEIMGYVPPEAGSKKIEKSVTEKIKIVDQVIESSAKEKYEDSSKIAKKFIGNVDQKEINTARQAIEEKLVKISGDEKDDKSRENLQNQLDAINLVASLKSLNNWETPLSSWAKRKVYEINDASDRFSEPSNKDLHGTIYQLSHAIEGLAEYKFPNELKKQQENKAKQNEKIVAEARERIKNMKIS